jgi:hypothetical protein
MNANSFISGLNQTDLELQNHDNTGTMKVSRDGQKNLPDAAEVVTDKLELSYRAKMTQKQNQQTDAEITGDEMILEIPETDKHKMMLLEEMLQVILGRKVKLKSHTQTNAIKCDQPGKQGSQALRAS